MTDPLERVKPLLDEAASEREMLRHQKNTADLEIHQLRRRLARAEAAYQEVDELNRHLKKQVEVAELRVEQTERATRDHVART